MFVAVAEMLYALRCQLLCLKFLITFLVQIKCRMVVPIFAYSYIYTKGNLLPS